MQNIRGRPAQALLGSALGVVQNREVAERVRDFRVFGAKGLLPDREAALEERLGVRVASPSEGKRSQIVEAPGDLRILRAERLLPYRQSPPSQRLRFGVAALRMVQIAQIVEDRGDSRVFRAARFFQDCEAAPVKRLGFGEAALIDEERRQIVEALGDIRMIGAALRPLVANEPLGTAFASPAARLIAYSTVAATPTTERVSGAYGRRSGFRSTQLNMVRIGPAA